MYHLWINQELVFTSKMFEKHLWKRENVALPQVFFKHFACKNQLPGFYISGTLVENGLTKFYDKPIWNISNMNEICEIKANNP